MSEITFSEKNRKLSKREYNQNLPVRQKALSRKISHANVPNEKMSYAAKEQQKLLRTLRRDKRQKARAVETKQKQLQNSNPCNCGNIETSGCIYCQKKCGFDALDLEMKDAAVRNYSDCSDCSDYSN